MMSFMNCDARNYFRPFVSDCWKEYVCRYIFISLIGLSLKFTLEKSTGKYTNEILTCCRKCVHSFDLLASAVAVYPFVVPL